MLKQLLKVVYRLNGKKKVVLLSETEQIELFEALSNDKQIEILETKTLFFNRDLTYRDAREYVKLVKGFRSS